MEVSGVVFRQIPCLSGGVTDSRASLSRSFTSSRDCVSGSLSTLGFPLKKVFHGRLSHEFVDREHLKYYCKPTTWCGAKGESVKEKIRKRAKMIKELKKDLNMFSSMRFSLNEVENKEISEQTEILFKQLEQLKAEEKELKKKKKEEKAKVKAMKKRTMMNNCESSSSSSSESSDSERNQVVDIIRQQNQSLPVMQPTATQLLHLVSPQTAIATCPALTSPGGNMAKKGILEECWNGSTLVCDGNRSTINNILEVTPTKGKRIEVCMGGKCKRSGGGELLQEFQRVMGDEGSVVGCKCMGKCRNGPNVRVLNQDDRLNDSLRTPLNPIYIGVGLQDVAAIVSGLIGEEGAENMGLAAPERIACSASLES